MKHQLNTLFGVLSLLLFQSCEYIEGLHNEGNIIETEIEIGEFQEIRVESPINLILEQSQEEYIRISGPGFKVNDIQIWIEGDVLVIDAKAIAHSRKDQMPTIHLPVKALKNININAPSEIRSEGELLLSDFRMIISGRGTYTNTNLKLRGTSVRIAAYGENQGTHMLAGKTENLQLTMEGLAWTDASDMEAAIVNINQRSLNNIYVQASSKLTVNMYSSGHVYFVGKPLLVYETFKRDWDVEFGKTINLSE